ncbi:MAG: VacJ family lipoprotein [Desulfuromonadales bacterium]|nr:VacJ family lipoprotein [Desulfuromonadales bacterium]
MQNSSLLPNSWLLLLLIFLLLGGCSTVPRVPAGAPPAIRPAQTDGVTLNKISDPLEGINRGIYRFNYYLDKYLLLPLVSSYRSVLPDFVENGISNALDNIGDIGNLTNALLQLKISKAGSSASRIVLNSTVGFLGIWDPATDYFNIRRQKEDFGQTLGRYGVGHGPYLILPLFGPSSLRDAAGLAADGLIFTAIDPLNFDHNDLEIPYYTLKTIDTRKREPFRYYGSGSPFEYELLRLIYTEQRDLEVAR